MIVRAFNHAAAGEFVMRSLKSLRRLSLALGPILCWLTVPLTDRQQSLVELHAAEPPVRKANTDHTMFGGTPSRNTVDLVHTGIADQFPVDPKNPKLRVLGDTVKWKAKLGSRSYGGPIVAGGRVYVGTNNENPRNNRDRRKPDIDNPKGDPLDKGVLMCFDEQSGRFQWQAVHDKLNGGLVHDWPKEGVCSTPTVVGDRVYYVSNRCTVVCLDALGFANGNDGILTEKYKDITDADMIWEYDMIKELNVFPHNMSACHPLVIGDRIFVVTANGVDEGHINIPSPDAPSFICLDRNTGKLLWKNNLPGKKIMHGQWSNACYGIIKDVPQVIFPGGDGWLRAFKPDTGELIWSFDANPKDSLYELGGTGTRSDFIGTPVIYRDRIFIGTGQDPEHGSGVGHFWCIDPAGKKGDISPELVINAKVKPPAVKPNPNSAVVWHYGGDEKRPFAMRDHIFGRTMSTACIVDDIVYIPEVAGYLHVLDAKTGKIFWQYDTRSSIWSGAHYVDGKVLVCNDDGKLYFFAHQKQPAQIDEVAIASQQPDEKAAKIKLREIRKAIEQQYLLFTIEMDAPMRTGHPIVANRVLYVMTENELYAIKSK